MPTSSETFVALSCLAVGDVVTFSNSVQVIRTFVLAVAGDESGHTLVLSQLSTEPSHIPFLKGGDPVKWKVSLDSGFSSFPDGEPFPIQGSDVVAVFVSKFDGKLGKSIPVARYQQDLVAMMAFK